ncbi:Ig-like domain-containing protein, partial [Sinorhizobium fredii]
AQTATITITGANDAPVNTVPVSQTVGSNTATPITGVAVADIDSDNVTTTLSVSSGKLTVGTGGGFTVNNNGTNKVTISGTLAQVNAALATLSYLSNTNYSGADTLTVVTSDGLASDADTVAITVTPPANGAPAVSNDAIVISTGTSVFLSAAWLLNNDADTDGDALSISASSIIGSLPSGWTITPVTAGGVITGFNVSTGNANQAATLSYTVDDGQGHTSTAQFTIRTPSTNSNSGGNDIDLASLNYNYSYIDGKDQRDELTANLTLTGTQGNDVFVGSSGDDVLDAGAGNNILTGGVGSDTFVFRNFASTRSHVTDFNPGANSTSVDRLEFEVGTAANEFSVGNNDTAFIFKTGNDVATNVAGTEVAVKADASVTNATVQSTINGYGNIAMGAFFVFHNTDLGTLRFTTILIPLWPAAQCWSRNSTMSLCWAISPPSILGTFCSSKGEESEDPWRIRPFLAPGGVGRTPACRLAALRLRRANQLTAPLYITAVLQERAICRIRTRRFGRSVS